jgi:hypothetical protein
MLRNLVQIMRARVGSKAIVVGVAAASLLALAGGWAFASRGPAHVTSPSGSLASAALHSAGSAGTSVSQNGLHAASPQAGTQQTSQHQSTAPLRMPAGVLIATALGLAPLNVQGHGTPAMQSATGGGSTVNFHFGLPPNHTAMGRRPER